MLINCYVPLFKSTGIGNSKISEIMHVAQKTSLAEQCSSRA